MSIHVISSNPHQSKLFGCVLRNWGLKHDRACTKAKLLYLASPGLQLSNLRGDINAIVLGNLPDLHQAPLSNNELIVLDIHAGAQRQHY